jgi:autotransporter-associated beta strand protein
MSLTKAGPGTQTLTGASNYTGPTNVTGGTLEVSGSIGGSIGGTAVAVTTGGTLLLSGSETDRLRNGSSVNLSSGTLAFANTAGGGLSETVGALTLSGNSTLDFGTGTNGNTISFGSVATFSSGTLAIWNWSGSAGLTGDNGSDLTQDRLLFDAPGSGFSPSQLSQISFYSGAGTGFIGNGSQISFGSSFEIVPVPEPSSTTLIIACALLGLIAFREGGRFRRSGQKNFRRAD